jgi:hypothetical protein
MDNPETLPTKTENKTKQKQTKNTTQPSNLQR